MARRDQIREDTDTVHVWVIRRGGTVSERAVRARLSRAKKWVESRLGEDGTWDEDKAVARYDVDSGPDYAVVEACAIPDALGLVAEDQAGGG